MIGRLVAGAALIWASPLLGLIALLVWFHDGRPVLFRQTRVGRYGMPFQLLKFRTMIPNDTGSSVTAGGDRRITRLGRTLRKYKLDELPQLWNVLCGEMHFVGPRPEVPRFVDQSSASWRLVLDLMPGITDLASLVYRDEEGLLAGAADPDAVYRREILPRKLALNTTYAASRTFSSDLKLMVMTVWYCLLPLRFDAGRVLRAFHAQRETSGGVA